MNSNFDFDMNQFPGMPGESYPANGAGFTFDYREYSQLADPNQQLPPAPFNLFNDAYSYQPQPAHLPHPSFAPGHPHMGQLPTPSLFSPPSSSPYAPSNGQYAWSNTTDSVSGTSSVSASASPAPPRSAPLTAAPPAHLTQQQQRVNASEEDQKLEQELLEMLDDLQTPTTDNFYQPYPQMQQQPGFFPHHQLSAPGGMYGPTDFNSIPSPYPASGNDPNEYSPPSSLIKPPPMSFDDDDSELPPLDQSELDELDLEDIELPPGVCAGDLAVLKIPDLNKKLRDLGMNRDEQNVIKKIRRQHKNRHYAHTCRLKKVEKKTTMRSQKQVLEVEINDLKADVERLRRQRDEYKKNYEVMQQRPRDGHFS